MKYKKLLLLMTSLLFITVAVFCFASAFKITDIELKVTDINGSSENVKSLCETELLKYKDENLVFVNVDKLKKDLTALSGYVKVCNIEKQFPNKLLVEVEEIYEAFVINNGVNYYALDIDFNVINVKNSIKNNVDGNDNLLLDIPLSDFNTTLLVGQKLNVFDGETFDYLKLCAQKIYSLREYISSVKTTVRKDGYDYKTLTLNMREGVSFTILKSNLLTLEKIDALINYYNTVENKGVGVYSVVANDQGEISVKK